MSSIAQRVQIPTVISTVSHTDKAMLNDSFSLFDKKAGEKVSVYDANWV